MADLETRDTGFMGGERIIEPTEAAAMMQAWDNLVDAHDPVKLSQIQLSALDRTIMRGGSGVSALVVTNLVIMADLAEYLKAHPSQMTEKGEQDLRDGVAREFPISRLFGNW